MALALSACDLGIEEDVMPPSVDVPFSDERARVVVRIGEARGFPDPAGTYRVDFEPRRGPTVNIMEGFAQATSVRHQTTAERLPSGEVAVALGETLCMVRRGRPLCVDITEGPAPRELVPALRWRANGRVDLRVRAYAAFSLARYDAPAAVTVLEDLEGRPYGGSARIGPHIRGVLARLRDDSFEIDNLRAEISEEGNAFLIGVARACVPALEAPIRAELSSRPESVRAAVTSDLAACR